MFGKTLKKVSNLLKRNQNLILLALVVIMLVVVFLNRDCLMNVVSKENNVVEKENTVNNLADVVSNTEEEEIKKELNNVLNNAVVNNAPANNAVVNNVKENFSIADCLAAGGDYESCK